jgi:adenosylcobinamide-GDP ribazoletransferase
MVRTYSFVKALHRFFYCWIFLTKLPCVPLPKASKEDWGRIAPYFVLVGYIIGLILFFLSKFFVSLNLPIMFSALLIVFLWELITGGLHLDGLMDTFDGVNCTDPARKIEAMKDSRVGAFGAMAGIFGVLFKLVTLCTILKSGSFFVILFAPAFARLMAVYALSFSGKNKDSGVSSSLLTAGIKKPQDFLVNLIVFIIPMILWSNGLFVCLVCSFVFSLIISYWLNRHFKGHSGDTFGALVEISEIAVLSFAIIFK